MTDDQIPNPFPNKARRAGAKLEPIAALFTPPARSADDLNADADQVARVRRRLGLDVDALPPPARTIAVGESIRDRIGDELPPLDTEVLDMTDGKSRRSAHRRLVLELDEARTAQLRLAARVWDLEAVVTELRARDMSVVGAVVRTLRKRLRGDR